MTTLRLKQNVPRKLFEAWTQIVVSMGQISADCDVRPNDAKQVFDFEVDEGHWLPRRPV